MNSNFITIDILNVNNLVIDACYRKKKHRETLMHLNIFTGVLKACHGPRTIV